MLIWGSWSQKFLWWVGWGGMGFAKSFSCPTQLQCWWVGWGLGGVVSALAQSFSCLTQLQCWGCVVLCCVVLSLGLCQLCNFKTGHIVRIRICYQLRIKHHPVLSYCMCSHVSSELCHVSCGDTCVQQSPATQQCSIHYPKCGQTRDHWVPL